MASSCTITFNPMMRNGRETAVLQFAWTAHTNGSFTSVSTDNTDVNPHFTITDLIKGFEAVYCQTDPGSTAPQASYDITITDGNGEDIMGGNLADRSATATESDQVGITAGAAQPRIIDSALTLNISNNNVNGATGVVKLFMRMPQ